MLYLDILKTTLRSTILALFKTLLIISYAFITLWLGLLPLPNSWLIVWPLWSLWAILLTTDLLPSYLALFVAWSLGLIVDSLYGGFIGINAMSLVSISYLKQSLDFKSGAYFAENINKIVLIVGYCLFYQVLRNVLQWIVNVPTQIIWGQFFGATVTTTLLWYYLTTPAKKMYAFFNLEGSFLSDQLS